MDLFHWKSTNQNYAELGCLKNLGNGDLVNSISALITEYLTESRLEVCVKSVQIRSLFWSVFSCIRTEYWRRLEDRVSYYEGFNTTKLKKNRERQSRRFLVTCLRCWKLVQKMVTMVQLLVKKEPSLTMMKGTIFRKKFWLANIWSYDHIRSDWPGSSNPSKHQWCYFKETDISSQKKLAIWARRFLLWTRLVQKIQLCKIS